MWLFSPALDVAAFFGTAVLSALVAFSLPSLGIADTTPPWAFLVFVVFIDVAHVWSTLFRVYLDGAEVQRRAALYLSAPVLAYALGVAAHVVSPELFWRVLAYVAAWHFVRQQVGWMVLYGRRAKDTDAQVRFDTAAIYAATLGPVVWWHANLPRAFWWFREGDFIEGLPGVVGTVALILHAVVLVAWLGHALVTRRFHLGKTLLLFATWLSWFGGIVLAESDLAFTVMNVALHGVPYLVLTRRYAAGRAAEGGYGRLSALVRFGVPAFLAALFALAWVEEFFWDHLVWHEHPMLFGGGGVDLGELALAFVVPLLSLPQTTHYLLDGFVWRTRDDAALAARLGWGSVRTVPSA